MKIKIVLIGVVLFCLGTCQVAYAQPYRQENKIGVDTLLSKVLGSYLLINDSLRLAKHARLDSIAIPATPTYGGGNLFGKGNSGIFYQRPSGSVQRLDSTLAFVDSARASWKADTLWGDLVSQQITYADAAHLSLPTVWAVLDSLLNPYVAPGTPSFSTPSLTVSTLGYAGCSNCSGSSRLLGDTITQTRLAWTITLGSEALTYQALNNGLGSISTAARADTDEVDRTATTTYRDTITDGTTQRVGSTTITFYNHNYTGVSSADSISDAQMIANLTKTLSNSKPGSLGTISPSAQYIYVCYPSSLGTATFTVNGLPNTDWKSWTRTHVNESGRSTTYQFYRHTTSGVLTGSYTIVVN